MSDLLFARFIKNSKGESMQKYLLIGFMFFAKGVFASTDLETCSIKKAEDCSDPLKIKKKEEKPLLLKTEKKVKPNTPKKKHKIKGEENKREKGKEKK